MARTVAAATLTIGGLVIAGASPAVAATGDPATSSDSTNDTVSVSGHGSVKGTPDTLISHMVARAKRGSSQAALEAAGQVATRAIDALLADGVKEEDLQTSGISVGPIYNRHGRPTGFYRASEHIVAKMSPLELAGKALDDAAAAGGNGLEIDYSSLTIADKESFRSAARERAFENAKATAEQYAELAGRQLGRAESIVGTATGPGSERISPHHVALPNTDGTAAEPAPSKSIPVHPGKQKVSASVDVVWALE